MCVTETWQKEEELIRLNDLCPVGFAAHGKPRPHRGGGGLAFVHKEDYVCKVIPSQEYTSFESQMVNLGTLHPLYCVVVYRPPAAFLKDFSDFLSSIIKLESL